MKKTPLANLIDQLKNDSAYYTEFDHVEDRMYKLGLDDAIKKATELLEEERQNLMDAVTYGNRRDFYDGTETLGDQYFNENYQQ